MKGSSREDEPSLVTLAGVTSKPPCGAVVKKPRY